LLAGVVDGARRGRTGCVIICKAPGFLVIVAVLWGMAMVLAEGWRAFEMPALAISFRISSAGSVLASPLLLVLFVLGGRMASWIAPR
jgi:hypothetical protein